MTAAVVRQAVSLFHPQNNKQNVQSNFTYQKGMTIKGKKNSKVKIIKNKIRHNYWGNIFRRKRIMSEYFSDSAFGSQSDTKIELVNLWEDKEKMAKYRAKRIFEYTYDENEIMPERIAFMHEPTTTSTTKKNNNNSNQQQQQQQEKE